MAEQRNREPLQQLTNVVKLVADTAVLPGISLLVDGKVKSGIEHTLTGGFFRYGLPLIGAAIGPVTATVFGVTGALSCAITGLNSYSRSTTGKSLLENAGVSESNQQTASESVTKTVQKQ